MIDRLRQMAIFAKTIDHGSFRGAARALRLSPSVVSHHVGQLEETLGVALMYRSTRKLTLTREGERLLAAARRMLEVAEGELTEISAMSRTPSGELRVTIPSVLSQSRLMDRISAFSSAYPRIRLSLDFSDTRRDLISGGFDLAIRMGRGGRTSASSRRLFSVRRRLVASAGFIEKHGAPDHPAALAGWAWLGLTPTQAFPAVFQKAGAKPVSVRPEAGISANDSRAIYQLARSGAGLAVVPDILAEEDVAAGRMQFVLPDWDLGAIPVFADWPANAPRHGLIHLALEALGS